MRRVWLAAAISAAMFSFVLLAPQLGARVGQAQGGRGNLLRVLSGSGHPLVRSHERRMTADTTSFGSRAAFAMGQRPRAATGTESALLRSHPPGQ